MEEDQTIQAANEAISTIESLVEGRASGAKWLPERARAIISSNTRRVMELLRDGSRPPAERLARAREFAQGGLRSLTDFVSSDSEPIVAAFLRLRDICFNDSSEESDVWRELKVTRTFTLIICRLSSALMPRQARKALGGVVYHVLNRANGRLRLFKKEEDFLAFEHVLQLAHERVPIRILDWCLMSNHWHFVLYPKRDGELTAFMRWLTLTHAQRWKHAHAAVGHGHLYQGRFKSFPIEQDEHLLSVLRYVERNPLRANLVKRAQDWRWGSCHVRQDRSHELYPLLSEWPLERPPNWLRVVNEPQSEQELASVRDSVKRGRPFGTDAWVRRTARLLNIEQSLRPRGRPVGWRKRKNEENEK